ncbi:MAG TPA: RDD family protein [Pyrinomonadaceae bacterium]|nr:RDD family protein [Pyrinomonadaceae bacterium]
MSAVPERTAETKRPPIREVIEGFSPDAVTAPFLLRCGAVAIDYILVIGIPVIGLLLSRFAGNDGAKLLNDGVNNVGWLIAFFVGVSNVVVLPIFTGQSLGKIVTGLRVVNIDGTSPAIMTMVTRQTFGYLLAVVSLGLGFLFACLNARHRALHDYLTGTIVIYADRRVRREP